MPAQARFLSFVLLPLLLAFPTAASAQISDPAALDAALTSASPGDVVVVSGHVVGDFTVPAGVTLRGADEAVIEGSGVGATLTVIPGSSAVTTVDHLKVVTDGRYGIWISGAGATHVDDVMIAGTRGVGLAAEDTDALALTDVRAIGPITGDNQATVPADASAHDWATHGIILLGVGDAALDGVTATGFAQAGAIIAGSTTAIWASRFDRNVGSGLVIASGETTLDDVTANGTFRGARGLDDRAAGVAIGGDANVTTTRTRMLENDGFGIFHDGSGIVDHAQVAVLANREGGVWTQNAEYVGLEDAAVSGNASTGIVAIDSTFTMMADVHVIGTSAAERRRWPRPRRRASTSSPRTRPSPAPSSAPTIASASSRPSARPRPPSTSTSATSSSPAAAAPSASSSSAAARSSRTARTKTA